MWDQRIGSVLLSEDEREDSRERGKRESEQKDGFRKWKELIAIIAVVADNPT